MTLCATGFASAANPSCEAQAADQKLSVAAGAKFIKKCQVEAKEAAATACSTRAEDQNLTGSAKSHFVKKCVKQATTGKRPANAYPGIG
jgi:hypothetical protein